jgi:hypothetical protein
LLEAHVEQGLVLEDAGEVIGIVIGATRCRPRCR